MEVELDLWSSRSNDAVDHILSDVDCLGDVVGDVDVDEFMQLACSPADTTSPSCGDDERRARDSHAFTPDEPVLHHQQHALEHHHAHHAHHAHHHHEHHHDLTSALHSARQPFCGQPSGRGQLHNMGQLHHQLNLNHLSQPTAAAAAAHLGLESMFDEAHQQQQQQQEAGEQASGAFQLEHSLAYHHALAGRLAASDPNDLHSHAHQFDSGAHQQQQQQLYAGTDLNGTQSAQHPGGYLAQDLLRQQQQQVSTTTTSTSATNGAAPSSSLVAARADHCYITAESASGQVDGLRQMGGAREEPAGCLGVSSSNGAAALPDREQLQRLLESRPQPISCALGESPLIAAINSKSQAPLTTGGNKPAGARGRRAAAPASKRGAKQAGNNQEASSTAAPQQPRNNNAKRAETMAAAAAAAAGGSKSLARAGARTRKTPPGGPLKKARVSGQVSPTLSAGSSSGVSSLSSPSGAASPSAQCAQPPEGPAGGPGGRPAGKRRARAQQQQQGGKATATTGQPAGALTRKLKGGAPDERRTAAAPAGVNSPAGAISSSSAARSASQLSFEANLSAKSREKLSSLSSCLISASGPPASSAGGLSGEQQQQASSSGGPAAANQRAAVSSSSSCSSPLASFAVSSASTGPQAPSARLLASSSPSANSSCSSSFGGSLRSPPSQRDQLNGSPVSSVSLSCSPTMQLGAGAGALGACSSSASGASAATTTASSAPTAASSFSLGSCSSSSNSSSSSSAASTASSSASCSLSSAAFSQQQQSQQSQQRPHQSACLLSDQDWKSAQTGQAVRLTEEERRTLLAAGYPIPQRFPLSKAEERSLKKVRRKIKNKISAQESRRKKKEYMEELEKRVQLMEARIVELERDNERLARTVGEPAGASRLVTTGAGKQPRQRPSTKAARQPATMTGAPSQQPKSVDLLRSFAAAAAASAPADERQSVISPSQPQQQQLIKRKDSVQSNLNDDDHFIDDILMSQERQEAVESAAEAAAAAAGADIKVERHELLLE